MKLMDILKKQYHDKLKEAIQAGDEQQIATYQMLLRKYASHDITHSVTLFTQEQKANLKTQILTAWKNNGFPVNAIVGLFAYGSWINGTNQPNSALNIYLIYLQFDKNKHRLFRDKAFDISTVIPRDVIKAKMQAENMYIELNNNRVALDVYVKETTSVEIPSPHVGAKIYL